MPLVCFALPLGFAYWVTRHEGGWMVAVWSGAMILGIVWAIWNGRQMTGFDGTGYAIIAMLMLAPAVLGSGVGAALAGWRARRARSD